MSDLYHETTEVSTAEPDTSWQPAQDAASYQPETTEPEPGHGYEASADADRYGEYHETEADTEARIAGQDELPTPQESRAATWGDNPDYYDETDLATEYDGDIDAFIAEQDELPTPQESGAATWGDNPEYYDETDLATEYDGDLNALTTTGHNPDDGQETAPGTSDHPASDQHTQVGTDAEDTAQEPPDTTAEGQTSNASPDFPGQDTAHGGDEPQSPEGAGPSAAGSHQAADASTSADDPGHTATDAQQDQPDSAGPPGPDTASETDDRIKALLVQLDQTRAERDQATAERDQANTELDQTRSELDQTKAELDQANQKIDDLHARNQDQPTPIADSDQLPDSTPDATAASQPERRAEHPGVLEHGDEKSPRLAERKGTSEERDPERADQASHTLLRHVVSSDGFAITGALIDSYDAVSKFAMHAPLDAMTPVAAVAAGLISLGLAKAEKHRKEKNKA